MKHIDPVMKELWAVKDANAAKFGNIERYLAHLKRLENQERASGRVMIPMEKAAVHKTA